MNLKEELVRQLHALNLEVSPPAAERLIWLLEELLRWNRRINLTAVTDPLEGVEKHLTDSLTMLPFLGAGERFLDVGSGGGFPCIPLKIALPDLQVCSAEASRKKVSFQRHVARTLGLTGFVTVHARVEPGWMPPGGDGFDVIVSRAFGGLWEFVDLARPFLRPEGRIIAMKGPEGEKEAKECPFGRGKGGMSPPEIHRLGLPVSGALRTLIVLRRAD